MGMRYNDPSDPNYRTNEPSMGLAWESHYVTQGGTHQGEMYFNVQRSATNTHPRPWGWSFVYDYPMTVLCTYNAERTEWNAIDQLPSLAITTDSTATQQVALTISRQGFLDFSGNTNWQQFGNAKRFISLNGSSMFGVDSNNFTSLDGIPDGNTNAIALFPQSDLGAGGRDLHVYFGLGNYKTVRPGIRCITPSGVMQYRDGGGSAWTSFKDGIFPDGITVSSTTGRTNLFLNKSVYLYNCNLQLDTTDRVQFYRSAGQYNYIRALVDSGIQAEHGSANGFRFLTGVDVNGANGTERVRIDAAGLGIGTNGPISTVHIFSTDPDHALHVASPHGHSIFTVNTNGSMTVGASSNFTVSAAGALTINAGITNSIDMLDTNGTTRTKIYSQGGTLYSSASPSSRTVSDDEWKAMNGSSTTTGIDGKSIANTTLYTVPTGRQLIVERVIIIPTTTAAVVTPPTMSIGKTGAAYIDVVAAGALTGLTATLTSATLAPIVGASVIDSGESLVLRVSSGASATSYTFKAVVIGTLL